MISEAEPRPEGKNGCAARQSPQLVYPRTLEIVAILDV
jgi:hypothetical protein